VVPFDFRGDPFLGSGAVQTEQATIVLVVPHEYEVAMGRFYFHLQAGDEIIQDDEGTDLPDLSAAQREAALAAREVLAEAIKNGRPTVPEACVISDEEGHPLGIVPLAAVLPKPLKK
jgi:hypothetical protein